ncbi:hypothetical protein GLOIN_2v1487932 [Rhizophagus irregularis DAOM 181602=DAOM 197198]|nr:hypothetical protein GLOIN_2v1487932 [Rhizophagus irregularis DAOM 181602=DAOM 197198]
MYNEIKRRIWIPRCDEVKRLEEKINIKKADLRKNKKDLNKFPDEDEKNDKNDKKLKTAEKLEKDNKNRLNKKISLVTLNKLTDLVYILPTIVKSRAKFLCLTIIRKKLT